MRSEKFSTHVALIPKFFLSFLSRFLFFLVFFSFSFSFLFCFSFPFLFCFSFPFLFSFSFPFFLFSLVFSFFSCFLSFFFYFLFFTFFFFVFSFFFSRLFFLSFFLVFSFFLFFSSFLSFFLSRLFFLSFSSFLSFLFFFLVFSFFSFLFSRLFAFFFLLFSFLFYFFFINLLTLPPQHGRVAIVTGGSSGIGFHVTKTLCELGMHVIIVDYTGCTSLLDNNAASSNKKNLDLSIKSIKKQVPDAVLEGYEVDLSSMKSVHKFAHDFKSRRLPLHILVNNAGVMHIPYKKSLDGIEKHIAINFMGHFLLTILLLPVLNVSGTNQLFARVVNVSSSTHRVGNIDLTTFTSKGAKPTRYSPYAAYAQSKLAIIMGTYELARRLKAAKCFRVTVNSLHPGLVDSNLHSKAIFPAPLLRRLIGRFYKSPSQGADTVLYVALSPDLEKQSGGYYENSIKHIIYLSIYLSICLSIYLSTCLKPL
ncbi:DHRSX [Acanthosepion pharaonis]|uniref:DHRSX n=1 Tax=Acanthosepion pharaonis TaxID=158019 RepID=A0A812C103_ACAPH|nr:DHRSX [Sepia pharaonis]